MRRRARTVATIAFAALALAGAAAIAANSTTGYRGTTSRHGAISFNVQGTHVTAFRFVNACPADSDAGTLVPATIAVKGGRFSYRDGQFTITGQLSGSTASGTARDRTGDCDSGTLTWRATRA